MDRSSRSKEPPSGFGEESKPAAPMAVVKSAPMFRPAARPAIRCGMVMLRPLRWMKSWFARALRPGQGERTSPLEAGCQFVHRGSLAGAGASEVSRFAMSSGRSKRPFADTTLAPTSTVVTSVERMFPIDSRGVYVSL